MIRNASTFRLLIPNCLAAFVVCHPVHAAEDQSLVVDAGGDALAAEFRQLGLEFERVSNEQMNAAGGAKQTDKRLSDEEWLKQGRASDARRPGPDEQLLPRYLDFAKRHPDSPLAFDALFFVIHRGGPQTGDVHGKPWRLKEQALELMSRNHSRDPRIVHLFDTLGGSLPSKKTEAFLRQAFENGPNERVRAAAGLGLANYFRTLNQAHARSRRLKDKPELLDFERYWNLVIMPYLEKNFPIDELKNSGEIEGILGVILETYGDVPATTWTLTGPGNATFAEVPYRQPKTYGDVANAMLFELVNIVPGKPAPDIEGVDANGERFRLSDYRGKVVLLIFSANWCRPCVELYPIERQLVEQFRDQPFVLLSVNRDERIDTLKSAIASGKITWQCWWDGMDGPIQSTWNSPGAPSIFLLDNQHVIQSRDLNKFSNYEEFERAIDKLIQNTIGSETP